jgi:hypothetical protein
MYIVIETSAFQKQVAKIGSQDDMTDLKNIDIDKVAKAVERDAGQALPSNLSSCGSTPTYSSHCAPMGAAGKPRSTPCCAANF